VLPVDLTLFCGFELTNKLINKQTHTHTNRAKDTFCIDLLLQTLAQIGKKGERASKQASRGHTATHSPPLYPAPYVRIHLTTPSHPNHDGSGTFDLVCEADGSACTAHEAVLDAYFQVRVVHYIGVNHNHNRGRPGTSSINHRMYRP